MTPLIYIVQISMPHFLAPITPLSHHLRTYIHPPALVLFYLLH